MFYFPAVPNKFGRRKKKKDVNLKDFIEFMEYMEYRNDTKEKKEKEKKKEPEKKPSAGLKTFETFLLLTILSPIIGMVYSYAVIMTTKHMLDTLQAVLK